MQFDLTLILTFMKFSLSLSWSFILTCILLRAINVFNPFIYHLEGRMGLRKE